MSSDYTTLPKKLSDYYARFDKGDVSSPFVARNGDTTSPFLATTSTVFHTEGSNINYSPLVHNLYLTFANPDITVS